MADATPTPPGEQTDSEKTRQKLDKQRIQFGDTIKNYFPVLFILTIVIATTLIALSAVGFAMNRTMDATVLAASVQVAFGMVLGFVCVYIGLMMTWIGIDAAYSVEGDVGTGSFVLKSASPGLLFALGGVVLVSVSLHKKIEYEEAGRSVYTAPLDPDAMQVPVTPISPDKVIPMVPRGSSAREAPLSDDHPTSATSSDHIQFDPNQLPALKREDH